MKTGLIEVDDKILFDERNSTRIIVVNDLREYLQDNKELMNNYVKELLNRTPRFARWFIDRQSRKSNGFLDDVETQYKKSIRFKIPNLLIDEIRDTGYDSSVCLDTVYTIPVNRRDMTFSSNGDVLRGYMESSRTIPEYWSNIIFANPSDRLSAIVGPLADDITPPVARVERLERL